MMVQKKYFLENKCDFILYLKVIIINFILKENQNYPPK